MPTYYTIGFKSGNKVRLHLKDGTAFVTKLLNAMANTHAMSNHYYAEDGLMIRASDIEFIIPTHLVQSEEQSNC